MVYLNKAEAAREIGISRTQLWKLCQEGQVKIERPYGKRELISIREVFRLKIALKKEI